ncbi:MAG: type II secretion system minor pseudopilin GspK [Gammaproteobacteria bacterium]|jgi:general secretion pathway protein K|nr:type II secretion system minor pseudopilin GspK [Gammaproteobacteria bacterium]
MVKVSLQKQTGVALLAALIFMLAIVLTLGNIFYSHQLDVARLTKNLHSDQALLLALSAESWARQLLSSDQDDRTVDNLQENWAIAVPVLPVEGGFLRGCLQDLQGRVNLSSFSTYDGEKLRAEMENQANGLVRVWLALLRARELPFNEASVATIIDWVDSDNAVVSEWGAEQQNYEANRELVMVANSALTDVEELAIMRGYGATTVSLLKPWISALPKATSININTAPEQLLFAMGGESPQVFTDYVLRQRPFYSLDNFHEGLSVALNMEQQQVVAFWPNDFVGITTDYFQLQLEVTLGESQLRINSVLSRSDRDEPVVISRTVTMVPAIIGRLGDDQDNAPILPTGFCEHLESS